MPMQPSPSADVRSPSVPSARSRMSGPFSRSDSRSAPAYAAEGPRPATLALMEHGTSRTRLELRGSERFQMLRRELDVSTFGLNLIRLAPGRRGRIRRHRRQEEAYLVLEG